MPGEGRFYVARATGSAECRKRNVGERDARLSVSTPGSDGAGILEFAGLLRRALKDPVGTISTAGLRAPILIRALPDQAAAPRRPS